MAPKSKSKSKSKSNASLRTPSSLNHIQQQGEDSSDVSIITIEEEDLQDMLINASNRFPSLIANSAITSRFIDIDSQCPGSKIWLSEPSMLAASLTPASIVSVSLAAPGKRFSNGFPLGSFMNESDGKFCIDQMDNEVGTYFALATVFPSTKVLKDGARLSSDLLYTMGSPAPGHILFVYPLKDQSMMINESHHQSNGGKSDHLRLHNCKELYLDLVSCIDRSKKFSGAEKVLDQAPNGLFSSPKTPLNQSKFISPSVKQLTTPTSNSENANSSNLNVVHIREMLTDENAKKLLQTCATSWLYSRCLLYGNLVAFPVLSELCIFRVIGANSLPQSVDENLQDLESANHMNEAFVTKHYTKIHLSLRSSSGSEVSQNKSSSHLQLQFEDVKANVGPDYSQLGGLSKEYETLKDIIISSSKKNGLSSFGLRTTKGVLLRGPPGTGKTTLAQLCARDAGVNLFPINGPEIISQYHGESEQALHKVFESASQALPAVVRHLN
ncbi:hypothetical protein ACFE04_029167 [Oxalis oulophora]